MEIGGFHVRLSEGTGFRVSPGMSLIMLTLMWCWVCPLHNMVESGMGLLASDEDAQHAIEASSLFHACLGRQQGQRG